MLLKETQIGTGDVAEFERIVSQLLIAKMIEKQTGEVPFGFEFYKGISERNYSPMYSWSDILEDIAEALEHLSLGEMIFDDSGKGIYVLLDLPEILHGVDFSELFDGDVSMIEFAELDGSIEWDNGLLVVEGEELNVLPYEVIRKIIDKNNQF